MMRETASDLVDGHEFQDQRRPSMASSSVKSILMDLEKILLRLGGEE